MEALDSHMPLGASLVTGVTIPLLEEFIRRPTTQEARAWGSFPHDEDQLGKTEREVAPPFGLIDFWTMALGRVGHRPKRPLDARWLEGRLAASSGWIRTVYRIGRWTNGWLRMAESIVGRRRSGF
jgi:hypothetical protein